MSELTWMLPIAFGLTTVTLFFLLGRGWAGLLAMDTPNTRSSHEVPTPRIGGLVLVPVALGVTAMSSEPPTLLLSLAAMLCGVSFADDRWGLPVIVRFLSHLVAAVVLCVSLEASLPVWALAIGGLALVWVVNLYNFMDGTNGLAGGMALFGFGILGWTLQGTSPGLSGLAFCVAVAAGGFLLFNFHPARVFMGDGGSVPLGFLAGGVGLVGWVQEAWPIWFPMLVFSPFLVDATMTLLKRLVRGEKVWHAHREHYYQRVVQMGWSHRRLALAEYGLMAACGASALGLLHASFEVQLAGLSVWAVVYVGLMVAIDRRWSSSVASRGGLA